MKSMIMCALFSAAAATPRNGESIPRRAWKLDAPQVNSTLYSESLCPDCVDFETNVWKQAYNTKGIGYETTVGDNRGIVSFNQVSFGNARISADNKTITCQHGPNECLYNILESCVIAHYPASFVPFVYCLSDSYPNFSTKKASACAALSKMNWATLNTCWTGTEGKELEIEAAAVTAALQPPHQYVPWVVLDAPGTICGACARGRGGRWGAYKRVLVQGVLLGRRRAFARLRCRAFGRSTGVLDTAVLIPRSLNPLIPPLISLPIYY